MTTSATRGTAITSSAAWAVTCSYQRRRGRWRGVSDRGTGEPNTECRDAVAYVCDQLDYIRRSLTARDCRGAAPLDRLLTALHNGEELSTLLQALHEALLAAGDAAGIRPETRGLNPIGTPPAMPHEWVLLCPSGECSRHAWLDGSEAPPTCRISGHPLRKERL